MKTVKIKSAVPLYLAGLTWLLFGLFATMYRLIFIFIAACASLAVYLVASVFFPGRTLEVEKPAHSGDAQVDAQIEQGRSALRQLRNTRATVSDGLVASRLERMIAAGEKIFDALESDVSRAGEVRKFMNYYLPTAQKLLASYRELLQTGSTLENVAGAMRSIENSLEMIALAFEKQLDFLYRHEALDIATDIDVLETMLKADNLVNFDHREDSPHA